MQPYLLRILLTIPGIILGFAFHEFAHAWTADRLGDPTPRSQGRLTLNPMSHMDPLGMLLIILVGFGWAKPVMTNPRYYRNPKRDDLLVSFAGPASNLLIAFFFAGLLKVFVMTGNYAPAASGIYANLYNLLLYTMWINITLFLFNLFPIPPLDGFHILQNMIPPRSYRIVYFLEQYGSMILLLLIVTNVTSYIISPIANGIMNLFLGIFGF